MSGFKTPRVKTQTLRNQGIKMGKREEHRERGVGGDREGVGANDNPECSMPLRAPTLLSFHFS